MLELVDKADSKSVAKWRPGSNPGCGTNRYASLLTAVQRLGQIWFCNDSSFLRSLSGCPAVNSLHTDTRIQFAFEDAIYKPKGELHMDNIAEFILQTAEEAKRRGLEICIASVQVAPQKPESKPVAEPARTLPVTKEAVREQHSRLRVAEAARMLNVSLTCLYTKIRKGEIPVEIDRSGFKTVSTSILQDFQKGRTPQVHSRKPVAIRCTQTGLIYPSITAAADAMKVSRRVMYEGLKYRRQIKSLTFEKV